MRILHVCNHFSPCIGGIEKYVEDLCNYLTEAGHVSDVVCLDKCPYSEKKLIFHEKIGKTNVYRLSFINLVRPYYQAAPSVLQFIKSYDVIHVHGVGFFNDIISTTKPLHKKPIIISTHGGVFHTKKITLIKNLYFNFWCRLTMKSANCVIAHSKNDEKLFTAISKPILIPYGIDFVSFSDKNNFTDKSFIFVGRFSKNKNVSKLLKVAYYLKNRVPDFRLYMLGDGNERLDLEKMCKKFKLEKNVFFLGEKTGKSLLEYYKKSTFFLSASKYEGFGISTLEAMASGCIVIVNDIEAFRNFVEKGKNGFLIDYSNPEKASEKIFEIMKRNDLEKISKNARELARTYDWKMLIKRIEKIYKEVI
jgi:alpha-1,3-mannosyltransferase